MAAVFIPALSLRRTMDVRRCLATYTPDPNNSNRPPSPLSSTSSLSEISLNKHSCEQHGNSATPTHMFNFIRSSIYSPHMPSFRNETLADTKPRHCCRDRDRLLAWEEQCQLFGSIHHRDALLLNRDNNLAAFGLFRSVSHPHMFRCPFQLGRWLSTSGGSPIAAATDQPG